MEELFRYLEQSFVVPPPAKLKAIELGEGSDFQNTIRNDISLDKTGEEIRKEAENFIARSPVNSESFNRASQPYLELHKRLLDLVSPEPDDIERIVESVFDSSPAALVSSDAFRKNKHLLNDVIVAVKMVSGFGKVQVHDLVAMRQAIAFVEAVAANNVMYDAAQIKGMLLRPLLVPAVFLKNRAPQPAVQPPVTKLPDEVLKREALQKEYDSWEAAYNTLMSLRHDELQLADVPEPHTAATLVSRTADERPASLNIPVTAARQVLGLTDKAISKLGEPVIRTLEGELNGLRTADYKTVVRTVNDRIKIISGQLELCGHVKPTTKVYRLGINAFAVRPDPVIKAPAAGEAPDFKNVITRPVGVGNLQVVRQELLGYEATEISHIENVLQGEILRHHTIRKDSNELTTIEATQTTQFDERDLQSTIRNEMASETQKETGQQSTSAQDQTTTTTYGKLVENNKSNYAKTVTDRAVSSLTQQVSRQRIQREKKSFTEKSSHEFDNSGQGAKNVTGIYQWVDKKYKTRIMNYGARLLYDVVIPEPAAFLIESLQTAPQPEGLELIKPDVFDLCPNCLNAHNYGCLAAKYGVTGAVAPPPDDFLFVKQIGSSSQVAPPKELEGFDKKVHGYFFNHFFIPIPDKYKAIGGFVQSVRSNQFADDEAWTLEFFIGESEHQHFYGKSNSITLKLHEEIGEIPVTFRTWDNVYQYSFAIGIYCQRTNEAMEQWQLKTHAAIMNGYNRQLADYQDKLSKFQAMMRAQMAQAANYAHNPSIEQAELKKAFIYLLLSEHFNFTYQATPDPLVLPTDPVYMKKWGAMVAFFERAFEWENLMFTYYPYFWGRRARWGELILIQDISPQFEEFLKAGAARVVVPVRPGFEGALLHYQETGFLWMGEEMPDMFSEQYVSIIEEIKARNFAPGKEVCVAEWDTKLPTTLVMLREDAGLPSWPSTVTCPPVV